MQLFTTAETAAYLRLKERKIYEMVAEGTVPCTKVTGRWLFPKAELDHWLASSVSRPAGVTRPDPAPIVAGSHDPLMEWALRESGSALATLAVGSEAGFSRFVAGETVAAAIHLHGIWLVCILIALSWRAVMVFFFIDRGPTQPVHDVDATARHSRRVWRRDLPCTLVRSATRSAQNRRLDMGARRDCHRNVLHEHLLVALRILGRSPHDHLLAQPARRLLSLRRRGGGVPPSGRAVMAAPSRVVPGRSELRHLSLAYVRGQALPRHSRI